MTALLIYCLSYWNYFCKDKYLSNIIDTFRKSYRVINKILSIIICYLRNDNIRSGLNIFMENCFISKNHYICRIIEIKQMVFLEFKDKMFDLACFNIHQIFAWEPGFDRNNITRWIKKGYLSRLRQGYYAFPEYRRMPDYSLYFANRIYKPSYISLHTALSFYGMACYAA